MEYGGNWRGGYTMKAYITDDVTFYLSPNGCYTSSILASLCNLTFSAEFVGKVCNACHHGNNT
jgi:hypothetical protein